ncbi:hypothetical protein Pst134EB_002191 [Puccinia striiformis f. sp. tritici]|nr:hypothetical protein Pst134EB_002191 [Puccinia striiformis f. sp. tritici]
MLRLSRGGEDLKPVISEGIVELHHSKHHTVCVNRLNAAEDVIGNALNAGDISKQIELQAAIKFNGDGDLNYIILSREMETSMHNGSQRDSCAVKIALWYPSDSRSPLSTASG